MSSVFPDHLIFERLIHLLQYEFNGKSPSAITFQSALLWGTSALECQGLLTNLESLYFCYWKGFGVQNRPFAIETVQLEHERKVSASI